MLHYLSICLTGDSILKLHQGLIRLTFLNVHISNHLPLEYISRHIAKHGSKCYGSDMLSFIHFVWLWVAILINLKGSSLLACCHKPFFFFFGSHFKYSLFESCFTKQKSKCAGGKHTISDVLEGHVNIFLQEGQGGNLVRTQTLYVTRRDHCN